MSSTITLSKENKEPCPCGCAPCEETSCSLDCLEKPKFFSGQLLSDQDLTSLVTWVENKSRLKRFYLGWGIVCGLEVCCHPEKEGQVIVKPGYAISCCGDDIVVCEDTTVDLCKEIPRQKDCPKTDEDKPSDVIIGDVPFPANEVQCFNLHIRYEEEGAAAKTAFKQGTSQCEPSRLLEKFTIDIQPIPADENSNKGKHKHNHKDCFEVLDAFPSKYKDSLNPKEVLDQSQEAKDAEQEAKEDNQAKKEIDEVKQLATDIKDWFDKWLKENPLQKLCWVKVKINKWYEDTKNKTITAKELKKAMRKDLAKIIFYIIQDCLSIPPSCSCHTCKEDDHLPIAKVCVWRDKDECHVVSIETSAPYRRELSLDCQTRQSECVDVGEILGKSFKKAKEHLKQKRVVVSNSSILNDLDDLEKLRNCSISPLCKGSEVTLITWKDPKTGTEQVIGACEGSNSV